MLYGFRGSVMNASIAYFFGGGSVKYAKILCGSVNLVVFSSSSRAGRSAYFLADVGSILCGRLEIRGGMPNRALEWVVAPWHCRIDQKPRAGQAFGRITKAIKFKSVER